VRDKLLSLLELQKVDVEIVALKKSAEAYPKELADLDRQMASGKAAVDAERARLDELEKQRLNLEQTISEDKDKVRKWEARLSEQRSTREYSALAREIDIAKKGQQTMAEDVVELNKQALLQREVVKTKQADFDGSSRAQNDKALGLKAKLAEVEAAIKGIDEKRATAAKAVDASLLRQYENARKKRMPAVVAVVAPGTCTGCRIQVRPNLFASLVTNRSVDTCPSCSRMIYAEEVLTSA
jgi:uncharacterized protein